MKNKSTKCTQINTNKSRLCTVKCTQCDKTQSNYAVTDNWYRSSLILSVNATACMRPMHRSVQRDMYIHVLWTMQNQGRFYQLHFGGTCPVQIFSRGCVYESSCRCNFVVVVLLTLCTARSEARFLRFRFHATRLKSCPSLPHRPRSVYSLSLSLKHWTLSRVAQNLYAPAWYNRGGSEKQLSE